MPLNIQGLTQMVSKMTGVNQNKLNQAVQEAQPYLNNVNSKNDAIKVLSQLGVDGAFLNKVEGFLSHPLANPIANMLGTNAQEAKGMLEELKSGMGSSVNQNQNMGMNQNRQIDDLRRGLNRLKR